MSLKDLPAALRPREKLLARGPAALADEFLTQTLKEALALVDVRVIDHIAVGTGSTVSFAERGLS